LKIQFSLLWLLLFGTFVGIGLTFQYKPYRRPPGVAVGYPFVESSYIKVPTDISPDECVATRDPFLTFHERRTWNMLANALVSALIATAIVHIIRRKNTKLLDIVDS
jgi:hypothetical protein